MIELVLNVVLVLTSAAADRADPAAPGKGRRSVLDVRRRGVLVAGRLLGGGEEPQPADRLLRASIWAVCIVGLGILLKVSEVRPLPARELDAEFARKRDRRSPLRP